MEAVRIMDTFHERLAQNNAHNARSERLPRRGRDLFWRSDMYHDQQNRKSDESTVTTAWKLQAEISPFTCEEWVALLQLRRRYKVGHDLWSAHELERLRFFRWRYTTGKVEP
jgi:hypothetical protein